MNPKTMLSTKEKFGEVETPHCLVQKMTGLCKESKLRNKATRILDVGSGKGRIGLAIAEKISMYGVNNKVVGIEIQERHHKYVSKTHSDKINSIHGDFVTHQFNEPFDLIIGNLPFNNDGLKTVPTNSNKKATTSKTIWPRLVKRALTLLAPDGQLVCITPALWMKKDKAGIHELLTCYGGELKVYAFSAGETNKLFRGKAQTPVTLFSYYPAGESSIHIYDQDKKRFIVYPKTSPYSSLPMCEIPLISTLQSLVKRDGCMPVIKTRVIKTGVGPVRTAQYQYPNVSTCTLANGKPMLGLHWSETPGAYAGSSKLILAHKMYGYPYLDESGEYGILNRDIYVIVSPNLQFLRECKEVLSSLLALKVYESTRYRMRFLEKYAFEFIPVPSPDLLSLVRDINEGDEKTPRLHKAFTVMSNSGQN